MHHVLFDQRHVHIVNIITSSIKIQIERDGPSPPSPLHDLSNDNGSSKGSDISLLTSCTGELNSCLSAKLFANIRTKRLSTPTQVPMSFQCRRAKTNSESAQAIMHSQPLSLQTGQVQPRLPNTAGSPQQTSLIVGNADHKV